MEKRLENVVTEAKNILADCGIVPGNIFNVVSSNRMTTTWGNCSYARYSNNWEQCKYLIKINSKLLNTNHDSLLDTVVHELLHTCFGCMNHGANWKKLANIVNKKYPNLNIQRCTSASEKGLTNEYKPMAYKYLIVCNYCGQEYKRKRYDNVVKYPDKYRCGRCHHSHTLEMYCEL